MPSARMLLRFGEFVLDTGERSLLKAGTEVALEPKVFDCIALLASAAGKLVSGASLRASLWPDVNVGDAALRRIINQARKAFGDSGDGQGVIRTRKRLGYVFVAPVTVETSAHATASWPFVGRERELTALRAWLAESQAGGLCFVSGEAGIGKSSLLERLSTAGEGASWLWGRCSATPGAPAFWPFRELAARLLRDPALRARTLALLEHYPGAAQLVPELAKGGRDKRQPQRTDATRRFELCEELAALICSLSRARPLRIVIEDVHWADDGSLAMLDALVRGARDHALHIFVSYRPEASVAGTTLARLIGRHSGRHGGLSLQLEPLQRADVDALCARLPLSAADARCAPRWLEWTGGNPLFLHELLRHPASASLPPSAALPASLQHIVAERADLLPAPTRTRLDQAAVLGHEFAITALSHMAGGSTESIRAELEPALRAGLLRASPHPDRQRFQHALVSDALLARMPMRDKQAHHHAALRALSAHGAAPSELAPHAFEAGEQLPVLERRRLCQAAGDQALRDLAFDRAALHLGRALQLMAAGEASYEAAELCLQWARACWHADEPESALDAAFLRAAELAERAHAPALLAEAAIGFAGGDAWALCTRMASLRPRTRELAERAWQRLQDSDQPLSSWPDQLAFRLATTLFFMSTEAGEIADFERAARRALALAPEVPEPRQRLVLLLLRMGADISQAMELTGEMLEELQRLALPAHERIDISAVLMGGFLLHGQLAPWQHAASEIARLSETLQLPERAGERLANYLAIPLCAPVTRAVIDGRLDEAELLFKSMVEQVRRLGLPRTREGDHAALHMLLQLFGYLGRAHELAPLIEHALSDPAQAWFAALLRMQLALEVGDANRAREHFALLRASGFRPQLGAHALYTRPETLLRMAEACVEVGTEADAQVLYERLLSRASWLICDGAFLCWGSASRPLAGLAYQLGRVADAERHYNDALAHNQRLGHRPEIVRTQLGLARVWLARGRDAEARALIDSARAAAETMGMRPMLTLASSLSAA